MIVVMLITLITLGQSVVLSQTRSSGTAGSSGTWRFTEPRQGDSYVVEWTFTLDSTGGYASPPFSLPRSSTIDFSSIPMTFYIDLTSTYGKPKFDLFLQACKFTALDTVTIDTVCYLDSSETTTLVKRLDLNQAKALQYRLFARSLAADVNTVKVYGIIPKKEY